MQRARKARRAWKVHWGAVAMPNVPIAGPRRIRPTRLPQAPTAPPVGPGSLRTLPPLDYDDTGRGRRPKELETTRPGRRRRSNRVLWFVLGIAFGAVAAVFARADAVGTLSAARAWGASTLRALEHKGAPTSSGAPYSMATVPVTHVPSLPADVKNAPCPVDPGPDDPCAELLAPFAANIPTVRVEDLPAVMPVATVVVIARRHARGPAPAATHAPVPAAEESAEAEPTPVGVNPDEDEPRAKPTRAVPAAAPPAERPVTEPPVEQKSAKNEPT
jgi:hypothetical protein